MANVYRIFRKEVGGYLSSPSAYIFLVIFLIMGPALFFYLNQFFREKLASLGGFFVFIPWLFLFFVPAIAMRIWAEEKRSGTEELLMTMPVRDWEAVLGKYLAALALIVLALVLTFPVPLLLTDWRPLGIPVGFAADKPPVDWAPVWTGYLGSLLLGASILAIGTWASSLTVNQIVAFIVTCAIAFGLIVIGYPSVTAVFPGPVADFLQNISLMSHFVSLYRGVIEASDIVYYLSIIVLFLFLNVRSVESRKWR